MTLALKLLSWIKSEVYLFARPLSYTHKMVHDLRTFQIFWRNMVLPRVAARNCTETEFLLSSPIRFTTDTLDIRVKFTKVSTSQSSQRKFLIKSKRERNK